MTQILKYRDANGRLTVTPDELNRLTEAEGREYFQLGYIYHCEAHMDDFMIMSITDDVIVLCSLGNGPYRAGRTVYMPLVSCGTFVPWVAEPSRAYTRLDW